MGYKMNISSLRKAFIFMGAVAALSLVNAQSALAANESAKDMTCQPCRLRFGALKPVGALHSVRMRV